MKIAILLGAVRPGRQSHKAAYYLDKLLKEEDMETDVIDLLKTPLPVFGSLDDSPAAGKVVESIRLRLEEADALIFVTPEYQGSFSGALKNTLDYYWAEFKRKPIGVVSTSTGKLGGINASTQLQHVILSLGAFPLPGKLLIAGIHEAFDDNYEPQNDLIVEQTNQFIVDFLWFAEALHQKKTAEEVAVQYMRN